MSTRQGKRVLFVWMCVLVCTLTSYVLSAEDKTRQSSIAGKIKITKTTEILLSSSDWKLGSFEPNEGEQSKVYLPSFDDSDFHTVNVPGEVQVQLGFKGMGLFHQNRDLTFVNEKEWWYRKTFVPPADSRGKNVRVIFEGVDYFSSVWLNGEKLGEHEGCFVPFSFDISSKLRYGEENCLVVKVTCPSLLKDGRGFLEYMKGAWTFDGFTYERLLFPFPPYRVGGLLPMGLFRDVRLVSSGTIVVDDLFVQTQKLNSDGSADLAISGTIISHSDQDAKIKLDLKISPENFEGTEIQLPSQSLDIQPGENKISTQVTVKNPQLWWTWDMGPQNLYKLTASICHASDRQTDNRSIVFGIRTIERHSDMSYWLNGKRVFLKGGWFPTGSYFLSTVTRSDYEKDLELFKAANLNSLVLWTFVENADFFDLCDRLGILEFFEFPFNQFGPWEVLDPAGPDVKWARFGFASSVLSNHPRREIFVKESLRQIRQIIIQLRNHPSIVLWCPFAEAGENAYEDYTKKIREIVEELAPGAIFHPSFCDAGEEHFWHGDAGYLSQYFPCYQDQFDANAGFVSEYGSIAIPAYETLSKILTPEQMWSSPNMLFSNVLNVPIDVPVYVSITPGLDYMLSKLKDLVDQNPRTLQEFIDDSQLYQAFIFKYSTESFRRKKYNPINGVRIWCYHDFAPRVDYSFVDYFHIPKMGYYHLKNAQQRFAINFAYKEALESQPSGKQLNIPVWVINDYQREIPMDVNCEIFDLKGQKIFSKEFASAVGSDIAKEIGTIEWTAPAKSGVYILRGMATEKGSSALTAQNTTFIKVVSPEQPNVPAKTITPAKELLSPLRILLIGQKRYSDPIADWLIEMGVKVDVIKEETIDKFSELRDADAIQKKYDVVWLTSFASLWKLMDDEMTEGLKQAIENGVGFIHTGGVGSFHGGNGYGALIGARSLAEAIPVKIHNRVIDNWFVDVNDIKLTVSKAKGWPDNLKQVGLPGFNEVELNPDSQQIMTVAGRPLLVSGNYGKGRTIAFTGFTPSKDQKTLPVAYKSIFGRMLVEVSPRTIREAYKELSRQYEPAFDSSKPLFENLKDLPETSLQLPATVEVICTGRRAKTILDIANGDAYARLLRIRVQWGKSGDDVPFVMFSDNYFDLLANEKKSVVLDMLLSKEKMGNITGTVIVEGPNIETQQIPLSLHSN